MELWCYKWLRQDIQEQLHFPEHKPPAFLTIDDRAITFRGNWHDVDIATLLAFRPWTHNSAPSPGMEET